MGRFIRAAMFLAALGCLCWFIFGSHSQLSLICFVSIGMCWYVSSWAKVRSLDGPYGR